VPPYCWKAPLSVALALAVMVPWFSSVEQVAAVEPGAVGEGIAIADVGLAR
jgi:hypothetical protein